jgi:signal peptidase
METPIPAAVVATSPATTAEAPPERTRLRLAGRILTWITMAVLTLIVLGVVAITLGPKVLPYQALVVRSGSMAPTIPTGSVVFYRKVAASKVKVGNIIVFSRPDRPDERVTHRVYSLGRSSTGPYFTTKGDANGTVDNWRVPAVGTGWREAIHVPVVGYALYDLQSPIGRLLLLIVPAVLLGLITIGELWRDRRNPEPT